MEKKLLIALFIVSSIRISAMEDFYSLTSFSLWSSSSSRMPHESELVLNLQKSIDSFENQLQLDKQTHWIKHFLPGTIQLFSIDGIDKNPDRFLQYCYYQKFHLYEFIDLFQHLKYISFRSKLQNAHINGHSALSAAMLARDVSPPFLKHFFIQRLIDLDFKATPEDIKTAELILYKVIEQSPQHKMALIHLLHPDSSASWHDLPQDIRKIIAHNLVYEIKKYAWFLPNKSKILIYS